MASAATQAQMPSLPLKGEPVTLDVARQTKYFLRCLKTFLPTPYQSNDSNRMSLAFFVLSALDLLGALKPNTTDAERSEYRDWIYRNQHPRGGFRAFPGADLGEHTTEANSCWDPANLPATYFALASLLILEDDLSRLKRKECLRWLGSLQRPDGSFGETLVDGRINGGTDSRFGYCATAVRYILRGTAEGEVEGCKDVDVDKLVQCIQVAETYDGGISDSPFHEAHAGFTYCAVAALSFLDRLPPSIHPLQPRPSSSDKITGLQNPQQLIRWLVLRQTATISDEDDFDTYGDETDTPETCHDAHSFVYQDEFPSKRGRDSYQARPSIRFDLDWTGFNGRCNKIADTCYAFWVHASLDIIDQANLPNLPSLRRWLLERTAHRTLGGFGKLAGDLPDVYHSSLALAALSLMGEKQLKPLDATMCVSQEAKGRLKEIWQRWGVVT
ncbi:hypothetical protein MBLNU459_g3777t1 [Dothideomycetes sp. NU459]